MMGVTKKDIFRYTCLPGLRPRFKELFTKGFNYIPYFMALVYQTVRLLPANHPYLIAENIGRYGIRHVIAEAANHLVVSRKNIDQVIVFGLMILGLGLVFMQIGLLVFGIIIQPAMATMPTTFAGFFKTEHPGQDIAYILLDMVFGVPDLFGSCVSDPGIDCVDTHGQVVVDSAGNSLLSHLGYPFPIHHALHQLLQLYSIGLLVVAALIASYFIVTIIAETAQTGTAFGKRFNKVWAPLRIVVAIGLLVPVGHGLNSAQYIVLYAAKYGSSFATNGWAVFNDSLGTHTRQGILGDPNTTVVAAPNPPEIATILQHLFTAAVCRELEEIGPENGTGRQIEPFMVKDTLTSNGGARMLNRSYGSYNFTTYEEMLDFADGASMITVRFGVQDPVNFPNERGYVAPICGEIMIPLSDPRNPKNTDNPPDRGAEIMQRYYWFVFQELWYIRFFSGASYGENFPRNLVLSSVKTRLSNTTATMPPDEFASETIEFYKKDMNAALLDPNSGTLGYYITNIGDGAVKETAKMTNKWGYDDVMKAKGWAGAGIWYNKIAELNGSLAGSVYAAPITTKYPNASEFVMQRKRAAEQLITTSNRFEPVLADGSKITFPSEWDATMAQATWVSFNYWQKSGLGATTHTQLSGNSFIDGINALFGTSGLFSMRKNQDVHPLAQLVGIGRSLVNAAIRSLGLSAAASLTAGGLSLADQTAGGGEATSVLIGFLMTITITALTVGFVLFYIVPFLPFIYFFFAVSGWVKGIFEAMVGAPLWALAHIRIDGNGLPGSAAVNGYFLIFEIFLRPILIIFGLLASISIFSAMVVVLNQTWDIVTSNLTGFDVETESNSPAPESLGDFFRGPIDEFFFTIIYAIVVYMMAMSSFKLIDLIPNNILRWMGQSVSTFNDQREDAAQGLVGTATVGGNQAIGAIGGGTKGLLQSVAKGGG